MAQTTVLSGLELTKWRSKFINEYVRDSGFEPYMGDSEMDIIHVVNDLDANGATIRIPLLARLQSAGVSGNQRLSGNEETLDQYYQDITWEYARNGVEISKRERERAAVDLLAAVRPRLKEWASERMKYKIIDTFHSMSDGTAYADASASTRNAWAANNSDRILFGSQISNYSATLATGLATVDSTNDKLTPTVIQLAKRMARLARPIIRPFKTGTSGREYYVLFAHPHCFRDLKNDTTMVNANREARAREGSGMDNNPLFQDGDLIYDGVIVREIPEFYQARFGTGVNTNATLSGVGASSITVGTNFLCGAQAIGVVNKQAATPTAKAEDDYGFFKGLGVEVADGYSKLRWNNGSGTNKDLGMVTVYASAVADT